MFTWNVLVTVRDGHYREAFGRLRAFGDVHRTEYRNVLVMTVADTAEFLAALHRELRSDPSIAAAVSRVVPLSRRFQFGSPEEFEQKARAAVDEWVSTLANRKFHVRMHRRGFKGKLSSQHEEQFLDHHVLERLELAGSSAAVDFDDPDFVVAVETLSGCAGLSLWTRQDLRDYTLLRID